MQATFFNLEPIAFVDWLKKYFIEVLSTREFKPHSELGLSSHNQTNYYIQAVSLPGQAEIFLDELARAELPITKLFKLKVLHGYSKPWAEHGTKPKTAGTVLELHFAPRPDGNLDVTLVGDLPGLTGFYEEIVEGFEFVFPDSKGTPASNDLSLTAKEEYWLEKCKQSIAAHAGGMDYQIFCGLKNIPVESERRWRRKLTKKGLL